MPSARSASSSASVKAAGTSTSPSIRGVMKGREGADEAGMVGNVADADDTRERVAARVTALAQDDDGTDVGEFARRYYTGIDDEDLAAQPLDDLAERALAHWRLARQRARGEAIVQVSAPPHGHTVIDIVNDDMPFSVDSVTMALERHDLAIQLVVHPIVPVRRTAAGVLTGLAPDDVSQLGEDLLLLQSWVHIEVDRETRQG